MFGANTRDLGASLETAQVESKFSDWLEKGVLTYIE